MEPRKDIQGQPLVSNLLAQVGKEQPNFGQLGGALLDMSRAIINGAGDTREVDMLRDQWRRQTRNGADPTGATTAEVESFQNDIQQIVGLKDPYDSHVFYVPGGSGIVRILISIDVEGRPKASLVDYGSIEKVKENFERLY